MSVESLTPVIIAAHNEEELIGRSLSRLPASEVFPIVVANGSTDRTAHVARDFGAAVIDLEEMGKLPAQQAAVRHLRNEGYPAAQPILFMDADSHPAFPKAWARTMRPETTGDTPAFVSGLTGYTDGNMTVNALRTFRRYQHVRRLQGTPGENLETVFGANMSITFGNEDVREQFLDLPHIWPGEDRATAHMIVEAGGTFRQSAQLGSLVLASGRYNTPLLARLRKGGSEQVRRAIDDSYSSRRASTATFSFDSRSKQLIPLATEVQSAPLHAETISTASWRENQEQHGQQAKPQD